MKCLFVSNAPWCATGYGTQTAEIVPRLRDQFDLDVAVMANYGLSGSIMEYDGYRVYPGGYTSWGNDAIADTAEHWFAGDPGFILTLYDAWTFKPDSFGNYPVACLAPVDHTPLPPRVRAFFEQSGAYPMAYSRFGEASMRAAGLDPLYVPHSIDTSVYRPRADAKTHIGLPSDRFLVGMVSTNKGTAPSRKAFDVAFRAFALFQRTVSADAILYVHSERDGLMQGIDLPVLASHYEIPEDNLIFADQRAIRLGTITPGEMAYIYSAFDVLSFATMGEGFGLPALEAQACGTPVILSDFSAQAELAGCGWKVPGQLWFDHMQAADMMIPSDVVMVEALSEAERTAGRWTYDARDFALDYDTNLVFDRYWKPAMARLLDEFGDEPIVMPA